MDDLLAARSQMTMSLAFHIVFAAIGIAMPSSTSVRGRDGAVLCFLLTTTCSAYSKLNKKTAALSSFFLRVSIGTQFHESKMSITERLATAIPWKCNSVCAIKPAPRRPLPPTTYL